MKIIADNKEEFERIVKLSKYLHDFCVIDKNGDYISLDLDTYDELNILAHLYRIKHAYKEGPNGILEQAELEKMFYVEDKKDLQKS